MSTPYPTTRPRRFLVAALATTIAASAGPAAAHPHVFITAKAELVFDAEGRAVAVRNVWQFDEAFSAFASQGLDADGDGRVTDAEYAPLAEVNVESLGDYGYFTWLTTNGAEAEFAAPDEYWIEPHGGRLTLFFRLPLKAPLALGGETTLEIFDPEYFVAFDFTAETPITLIGAPAGCTAEYHPPHELDDATMAVLSQIPAEERELPPELADAAAGLADTFTVDCP